MRSGRGKQWPPTRGLEPVCLAGDWFLINFFIFQRPGHTQEQTEQTMPEGPELHLSSRFVQKVGGLRQFTGKIIERLPANRSPRLDDLNSRLSTTGSYTVTSWSRGKELMIAIKPLDLPDSEKYRPEDWSIRFNFGMTGCFKFTRTDELPKHAKVW